MSFPEAPAVRHSPTSNAAAEAIRPNAGTLRRVVFDAIVNAGERGMTDEELQDSIPMEANTERPRRRELVRLNLIKDSGSTRPTRSGHPAVVWVAVTVPTPAEEPGDDSVNMADYFGAPSMMPPDAQTPVGRRKPR